MSDYKYSIEAKNVNKIFFKKSKQVNALIDFDIKIKKGSIHGLLGPNGAGKSTFINILGGLVKKNSGTVSICGINIDKNPKASEWFYKRHKDTPQLYKHNKWVCDLPHLPFVSIDDLLE